jgi:hypothetical protein
MSNKTEENFSGQYAIISYSHKNDEIVESELEMFKKNGIRFWYDEEMKAGTEGWNIQFQKMLDNPNCKGIIFFVSDDFLLSDSIADDEMKYFKEHYRTNNSQNSDKFCLFVLPEGYPHSDYDAIYKRVYKYIDGKYDEEEKIKMLRHLNSHIELFLALNEHGTVLHATLGNGDNYISKYCKKGKTFYDAGIISGYEYSIFPFGEFPQIKAKKNDPQIEFRDADKKPVSYKSVEWLLFDNNKLLSKELLFVVDYLSLKYPFDKNNLNNEAVAEQIKNKFEEYFRPKSDDKIKYNKDKIRFLKEDELKSLLMGAKGDQKKRREILMPEPTYFAQISNRKNTHAFWLAGDINDARRVDVATESLSEKMAGVELYYVRIVIEIEK